MKKMTDRELTDKISQVFEDFEDPQAEYGWQQLRKKYPEHNRRPVVLWWGATAAAIFLIVCGIWLTLPDTSPTRQGEGSTVQSSKENQSSGQAKEQPELPDSAGLAMPGTSMANQGSKSPGSTDPNEPVRSQSPVVASSREVRNEIIQPVVSALARMLPAKNTIHQEPLIALSHNDRSATSSQDAIRDSVINARAKMLALAQPDIRTDDHLHQVTDLPYASSQKANTKDVTFSFYAGSYFNYSTGSESKINFGAGFASDIKLSDNVRLSTGLALANNSLTYNNGVPSTKKDQNVYYSVPSFGSSGNSNNLTTITKYDASLLVLDIPVNIKYLLIPKDNKLYVVAGLSSGTYLSEMYALNYRNYSAAGTYINQSQGAEVKKQLQAFDFARTLNISFGYSANLGKTQNISIEPFLKYPLSGLGSEDLKFGSTGVNLKLNFSKFKK